jgi:putative NADPH-quinone reductase
MYLPCMCPSSEAGQSDLWKSGYGAGHQDARHAAAELVLAASAARSAEIQQLREALKNMADEFVKVYPIYYYNEPWAHDRNVVLQAARSVLKEPQQ